MINFFFIPQITIVNAPISALENSIPSQLASAQWSLFCLWELENEKIGGVLLTPLLHYQCR
jgi:hypothetical protein